MVAPQTAEPDAALGAFREEERSGGTGGGSLPWGWTGRINIIFVHLKRPLLNRPSTLLPGANTSGVVKGKVCSASHTVARLWRPQREN